MINILSTNLKTARKKAGLTQKDVAEKLYVTHQAVQRWEAGIGSEPSVSRLVQMADIYKITLDELIKGERNDNR